MLTGVCTIYPLLVQVVENKVNTIKVVGFEQSFCDDAYKIYV